MDFCIISFLTISTFRIPTGIDTWTTSLNTKFTQLKWPWLHLTLGDFISDSVGYNKSFLSMLWKIMINEDPKNKNGHGFVMKYIKNTRACLFLIGFQSYEENHDFHNFSFFYLKVPSKAQMNKLRLLFNLFNSNNQNHPEWCRIILMEKYVTRWMSKMEFVGDKFHLMLADLASPI